MTLFNWPSRKGGYQLALVLMIVLAPLGARADDIQFVPLDRALPLLWATLVALDHANDTENYSVLRDISSPDFQERNSADGLRATFAQLRESRIDLQQTLLMKPEFEIEPQIRENGLLRMRGSFAISPVALKFDLLYQKIYGDWRLSGIAVVTGELNERKITESWFRKRK